MAVLRETVASLEGELIDSDEANAGTHPGRIFFVKVKDNVFFIERTVIVGTRIYRFQAVSSETDKRQREKVVNHFFDSAKFLETDDDVPAPPAPHAVAPPAVAPPKAPLKFPKLPPPPATAPPPAPPLPKPPVP